MALPGQMPPLFMEAVQCFQRGDLDGAEKRCRALIKAELRFPPAFDLLGNIHLRRGAFVEAEQAFESALRLNPGFVEFLVNLASAQLQLRKREEAVANARAALKQAPGHRRALAALGMALRQLDRFDEAVECARAMIAADPNFPPAHADLGAALDGLGRHEEALACYEHALSLAPGFAEVSYAKGKALTALERWTEAETALREALRLKPALFMAYAGLADLLVSAGRHDEALAELKRAVAAFPREATLRLALGIRYQESGQLAAAEREFVTALDLNPDYAAAFCRLGDVFQALGRLRDAQNAYERAFSSDGTMVAALLGLGRVCLEMGRDDLSVTYLTRAYAMAPDHPSLLDMLVLAQLQTCSWTGIEEARAVLIERIRGDQAAVNPFVAILAGADSREQWLSARQWARQITPADAPMFHHRPNPAGAGHKIRVGYLSSDLHEHAIGYLTVGIFENHDRETFELHAYSLGFEDDSPMRRRIRKAFTTFTTVQGWGAAELARRIHADGIDILVDINAYTNRGNSAALAYRPAPIQVNYLGYPGTMGASFVDYVIADPVTVPWAEQAWFAERIVHLPHCYQPNDSRRVISPRAPTRGQCGLPDDAFVFCCFNNPNKLNRATLAVWSRLLLAVPGSVLWLLDPNAAVRHNLLAEFTAAGVAADRVAFASRVPLADHLARHRVADLFLDTLPYNAHTTASDSLWAGLPLLTCLGGTFAGRVAASLLTAVGLPELITATMDDYEAQALRLARDPAMLGGLRRRLDAARASAPLFDTALYTRHLEAAYRLMWESWQAGTPPQAFAVPA